MLLALRSSAAGRKIIDKMSDSVESIISVNSCRVENPQVLILQNVTGLIADWSTSSQEHSTEKA